MGWKFFSTAGEEKQAAIDAFLPVGGIIPFAGSSVPSSAWLICDGSEAAIATYPALSTLVGTTYGALTNGAGGAGTTHFRLPDLRGRSTAGLGTGDASGATAMTLGEKAGEETHLQTTAEAAQKALAATGNNSVNHTHGIGNAGARFVHDTGGGVPGNMQSGTGFQLSTATNVNSVPHTHAITGTDAVSRMNVQGPVLGLNHIIRAL